MSSTSTDGNPAGAKLRLAPAQRIVLIAVTAATAAAALFLTAGERLGAPRRLLVASRSTAAPEEMTPFFAPSWVTPAGHTPSVHSCAMCLLPGGDLLAVWFGGSREGAADVDLFTARQKAGTNRWSAPRRTVTRESAEDQLGRLIKKVGNAVIFPDQTGTLWLVYVTVTVGGWSGSALNVKTSSDEGRNWTDSQRLTVNPFLNLSSLVRNKPVFAEDGRIGLPVYHEMALTYPQMLWLTPGQGGGVQSYVMRNVAARTGLLQPALVPLGNNRVAMVLRDHGTARRMYTSFSDDNGWSWSAPAPSALPNPDAAVDALRLRDGRILFVYNDTPDGRDRLRLATSSDDGRTWSPGPMIEDEPAHEYSYPCLVEDQRGRIHLTYTWRRERIKHVEFNLAWLDQSMGRTPASP